MSEKTQQRAKRKRFAELETLLRSQKFPAQVEKQLDSGGRVFCVRDVRAKLRRCVRLLSWNSATKQRLEAIRRVDDHELLVPGIILIHQHGDQLILVTKWIDGHSLRTYLQAKSNEKHNLGLHQSVILIRKFVHGLSALHRAGFIVHGDIKPENIILSRRGEGWRPMLVDFGSSWAAEVTRRRKLGDGITPVYAAPECQNPAENKGNWLSDQFSATVVFYEMLTGEIPFDGLGGTVGTRKLNLTLPSEVRRDERYYPPKLLRALDEFVCKGLSVEPDERFPKRREWQQKADELVRLLNAQDSISPPSLVERALRLFRR